VIVVTGPLGGSAAGYVALRDGFASPLARAHLRPPLRLAEGKLLARTATAMLDLSDGLALDAGRLAAGSRCRVVVRLEDVPVADGVPELAAAAGEDVWRLVCGFGEDYELLAATPEPLGFTVIGRCEPGSGVEIRLGGKPVALSGWEHFGLRDTR
jgi:thiamine-monophosphate kinase